MKNIQLLKTTKTVQKLSLLCLTAGLLASVASAQTSLYIDNPGFELPATGKVSPGWDVSTSDVPGWMDAGVNIDGGVEGAVWGNSGSYSGYCAGGQPGAYQVTTNTMEWGKKYTLTWYMAIDYSWSDSSQTVRILSADATNTPFANCTQTAVFTQSIPANNTWHGPWSQHSVSFISGNAQVGKYIGMSFSCGNQWISFDDFALTVEDASPAELMPQITTQPVGGSVYEGTPVTFTAAATGPDLSYQWEAGAQGSGVYTNVPGATSATLTIASTRPADTADYVLYVTNSAGSVTSAVATLTVTPATYVNGLFNGDFELPALGKINAGYDVPGSDIPGWKNAGPNQNDSGIDGNGGGRNSSYPGYVQKGQDGAYQITPTAMQQGDSITLTWWERNSWQGLTAKVSLLSASSQDAAFGSTTKLASQTNVLSASDYSWYQRSITYTAGAGDVGKLIGVAFQSADVTTGGWGNFDDFSITVTPPNAAPVILNQPASQTVWLASTATFTVVAAGSGLSYQWQAGAVGSGIYTDISNGGQFSGADTASLTITNVAVANGADYVVTISNTGGSVTSDPATLTVNTDAPYIWSSPSSATVFEHATATLTAGVSGATTYQWQAGAVGSGVYTDLANGGQFSGVNTATLTIANVAVANGLDYVLVASNAGGTSTSSPATLTVTPAIYLQNFETSSTNFTALGWVADHSSGENPLAVPYWGGKGIWAAGASGIPQAFYTTTFLENGSIPVQMAFPVIKLADVSNTVFYVDVQSYWNPGSEHAYFAVQMNWGQWYVSATELDTATGGQETRTRTFDPSSSAWNQLTVTGTGNSANDATTTIIGEPATGDLTGYVTGAGLVTLHDSTSWLMMDNFIITGDGFTVLPGLSITPSGSDVVLTWGYGTLLESTSLTDQWTPASGTSPKTVSATDGSHFYRLQLP